MRCLCRAIEAASDGSTDVVGMAFWWSNCIQLRWMLWAMCHGAGGDPDDPGSPGDMEDDGEGGAEEFRWVQTVSLRGQIVGSGCTCKSCQDGEGGAEEFAGCRQ